jgi:tape measure domain-containing protein
VAKQLLPAFGNDVGKVTETFRMLGDTAGGNIQKLDSITRGFMKSINKGKVDLESLNMISEAGVPIFNQLADSMGISVEEMYKLSESGKISSDDLTNAFQRMTSEGGIFFDGMNVSSKTFTGLTSTMTDNLKQAGAALGNQFLPAAKEFVTVVGELAGGFTTWAGEGTNLRDVLHAVYIGLATLAAGAVVAFVTFGGGASVITGLATAFRVLTLAMAANPIGFIAVALTAVLIPAIILLVENWDAVVVVIQSTLAEIGAQFEVVASGLKLAWTVAFNSVKIAIISLGKIIADTLLGSLENVLNVMGKMPFVGEMYSKAATEVKKLRTAIDDTADAANDDSLRAIKAGQDETAAAEANAKKKIAAIKDEAQARQIAIAVRKTGASAFVGDYKPDVVVGDAGEVVGNAGGASGEPSGPTDAQQKAAEALAKANLEFNQQADQELYDDQQKAALDKLDAEKKAADELAEYEAKVRADSLAGTRKGLDEEYQAEVAKAEKMAASEETIGAIRMAYLNKVAALEEKTITRREQFELDRNYANAIGDVGGMASASAQEAFKGTEVGKATGMAGQDPLSMLSQGLDSFMGLFAAVENVNKIMNPLSTIFGEMFEVIGPAVNEALAPFIGTLEEISRVIGVFLVPIIQALGFVFAKINDYVLVPFANALIAMINGLIWAINLVLPKNKKIQSVEYVKTSSQIEAAKVLAEQTDETEKLTQANIDLAHSYVDDLKPAAFQFFDSLKGFGGDIASTIIDNLVNGFSGEDFMYAMQEYITKNVIKAAVFTQSFTAQVASIGADLAAAISGGLTGSQLDSLKARLAGLYTSASTAAESATAIVSSAFESYDVGSLDISGDQIAKLHNREMVLTPGLAEQARTAGVYIGPPAGLGGVGALTGSSRQTINLNASGVLNVDGREIGRIAFQYGDQFMGEAYGA